MKTPTPHPPECICERCEKDRQAAGDPCGSSIREQIRIMVRTAVHNNRHLVSFLPTIPTTRAQAELKRKHGSPVEFAEACIGAIGDISVYEAMTAIAEYKRQWDSLA